MRTSSTPSNEQRLRTRHGLLVTSIGLAGCVGAAAWTLQAAGRSPALCAALLCAGLLVTATGFAMMVAAADPFREDGSDSSEFGPPA